eukprot:scaffold9516_cov18-Tisochrysis_lutea.AAC.1
MGRQAAFTQRIQHNTDHISLLCLSDYAACPTWYVRVQRSSADRLPSHPTSGTTHITSFAIHDAEGLHVCKHKEIEKICLN